MISYRTEYIKAADKIDSYMRKSKPRTNQFASFAQSG